MEEHAPGRPWFVVGPLAKTVYQCTCNIITIIITQCANILPEKPKIVVLRFWSMPPESPSMLYTEHHQLKSHKILD